MEKYNKPQVISVDDMAEGVYAASGGVGPTSGTGANITWTPDGEIGNHDTSSHAAEEPHPIQYYTFDIPANFYGQNLHFSLDCQGPIRHAGFRHQDDATVVRTGNHVEGDFHLSSADRTRKIYVCCDPEYAPAGLAILSASVTIKS